MPDMNTDIKNAVENCQTHSDLFYILCKQAPCDLSISDIHFVSRHLRKLEPSDSIRIAYLSNFTVNPLVDYVNVFSAYSEIIADEYVGGYNQYFQEIVNKESALIVFDPQIIFLCLSIRKLFPEVHSSFSALSLESRRNILKEILSNISDWSGLALRNTKATILLCNFPRPDYSHAGIADLKHDYGEAEFYYELNLELLKLFKKECRIHIFDLDKLFARFGKKEVSDPKMYYIAKMEWSEKFLPVVAEEIVRFIKATHQLTKKCLVLDLDNTLWGGIVGEDGPAGIKVGHDDPESEAYFDFQNKILSLKNRGILLAICSKNNLEDIDEVFEKRLDMPLKKTDFVAMEINWDNKHENITKIAQSLNIGLNSLAFIDDNPAECRLIEQMIPEVKTILLPKDPSEFPGLIDTLDDFEKTVITEADFEKTTQYNQNSQRLVQRQKIGDLKSYLESLKTEIAIQCAAKDDLPRVHQLFTKTNQFNTTTIRYTIGQVESFCNDDRFDMSIVEARDRFGNLGVIGLYLLEMQDQNQVLRIDSFILSCRALGRGIECAMMNHIKQRYLNSNKEALIEALYRPTKKNRPAESFYDEQGFEVIKDGKTHEKQYRLRQGNSRAVECGWINIVNKEEYDGRKN